MKDIDQAHASDATVDPGQKLNAVQHSRRQAIQRLAKLGIAVPTATVLINMKVTNAFAEPGS